MYDPLALGVEVIVRAVILLAPRAKLITASYQVLHLRQQPYDAAPFLVFEPAYAIRLLP
jgi:hypothetical protein